MQITVTEYDRLVEVEFSSIPSDKQRRKLRNYFRWNADKAVWYSYDSGAGRIRSIFDDDEIEIVKGKQEVVVYRRADKTILSFVEIPSEDERAEMKDSGFKWDPESKKWYSKEEGAEYKVRSIFPDADVRIVTDEDKTNLALDNVVDKLRSLNAALTEFDKAIEGLKKVNRTYGTEIRNAVGEFDLTAVGEIVKYINESMMRS